MSMTVGGCSTKTFVIDKLITLSYKGKIIIFLNIPDLLLLVLVSAHVKRFCVHRMQDFV